MAIKPVLLDRWGQPVKRAALTEEVAAATLGGVRSPLSGHPGDGLNPIRLANILREADQGDPVRYLELAEVIEERDPHYLGVLGTRRRSVSQIEITVEAASDEAFDVEMANMVREWLDRDELSDELFDILDSIGKGYSFTEIIWDTSEGQWQPARLEWRDPRWFRFDRVNLATPMKLDDHGQEVPLEAFKFIYANVKAKSGLALRSGLARVAMWGWMFKAFTQRDWAIFSQTYGQPLRLGKWGAGASEADKNTLFDAVANIAGDCAAIIPESMSIDFVETSNVGASADLYEKRADWLDKQISKAVLGQTATTDAVTGGLGSGKEHRQVQEDIERADANALAAILNRDLIRPWIQLEHGPQKRYPRLKIGRPEPEDLKQIADALGVLVPIGLQVSESEIRAKFGFADPKPGDRILMASKPDNTLPAAPVGTAGVETAPQSEFEYRLNTLQPKSGVLARQAEQSPSEAISGGEPIDALTAQLQEAAQPAVAEMIAQVEIMLESAGSIEELREMFFAAYSNLDASALGTAIADAMEAADAGGRALAETTSG
ncbi:DUF935 domain-containing protein [Sulfitobacter sp. SK025]|uniref:DUF935 domain-containing protein n=1 Tax=Sulfitobacter sp. SK025 TaxID=1389011 RepID=UPI000E0C0921|nr:DUF935 domain-containing protein [Sulfitobacter sp. SK025]AXI50413.1 DUF935 domain-containing protein [Sulfitobacter sp. SK025]